MSDRSVESFAEERLMFAARIVGLLFILLTAGCAGLQRAQAGEPPRSGATQSWTGALEPEFPPASATHEPTQTGSPSLDPASRL